MAVTSPRFFFRDPNGTHPRLAFAQSYWALQGRDQSIETSLKNACDAGFEFLEAGLSEERMPILRELLRTFPLRLMAQGWATTAEDSVPFFERAVELNAEAMNLHLGHAYLGDDDAARLVDEAYAIAEKFHLPLMLETHRGRMTQDLFRTHRVMQLRPATRIALDVSHYVVAGETLGGDSAAFHRSLTPLLDGTELIHGRVSNGQQIQITTADADAAALTQNVWERAMTAWLRDAPQDAVLVFEPELGPPPYAFTVNGRETGSRDVETQGLCRMAQAAWDAVTGKAAA